MNELIKITSRESFGETIQTVNARDLHEFLGVGRDFPTWIKYKIDQFGFIEEEDFVTSISEVMYGRPTKEYHLSLDMAKELAMVENSEKGKEARIYFIECEKRYKSKALDFSPKVGKSTESPLDLVKRGYDALLKLCESQTKQIDEMKPIVDIHQAVSASPKTFTLEAVGKILSKRFRHIGPRNIFQWLRGMDILMGGSRRNQPRQEHVDAGRFEVIRHSWKNEKTGEDVPYVQTVVTQKGLDWITGLLLDEEAENENMIKVG